MPSIAVTSTGFEPLVALYETEFRYPIGLTMEIFLTQWTS
jgi:hypothetical protein